MRASKLGRIAGGLMPVVIAGATVLGAAHGSARPAAAAGPEPGTVRIGLTPSGSAGGLYGVNIFTDWPLYPSQLQYEYLFGNPVGDKPAQPVFAESWTPSADQKTWTFKIAADKKWSDGVPATAHDVAFTWKYLLDSASTKFELAVGWENDAAMKGAVESVTATDDQTVVFQLKAPSTYPITDPIWVLPEHVFKDISYETLLNGWKPALPMVGSGPFVTTEYKSGEFLRMEPNRYFKADSGGPFVKELVFSQFSSEDAAATSLANGDIDALDGLPGRATPNLAKDPSIVIESSPMPWYFYLAYNTLGTKGGAVTDALADPAFRNALGFALDKQTLLDKVLGGRGSLSLSSLPEKVPSLASGAYWQAADTAISPIKRTFDVAEANRRLDAAGYPKGPDGIRTDKAGKPLELRLNFDTSLGVVPLTAQFIADWFDQVGIKVNVTSMDAASMGSLWKKPADGGGNWDLAITSWWPSSPDLFASWTADMIGTANRTYFNDPQVEDLNSKFNSTTDEAKRASYAADLAKVVYQQDPGDILYFINVNGGYRADRFTGWTQSSGRSFGTDYPERTWQNLKPVTAEASPVASDGASAPATDAPASAAASQPAASGAGTTTGTGSGDFTTLVVAGVVLLVVIGLVVVITRRRREA